MLLAVLSQPFGVRVWQGESYIKLKGIRYAKGVGAS
jgi:hypothetical protein